VDRGSAADAEKCRQSHSSFRMHGSSIGCRIMSTISWRAAFSSDSFILPTRRSCHVRRCLDKSGRDHINAHAFRPYSFARPCCKGQCSLTWQRASGVVEWRPVLMDRNCRSHHFALDHSRRKCCCNARGHGFRSVRSASALPSARH